MPCSRIVVSFLGLALGVALPLSVFAAGRHGSLDQSFGTKGIVTTAVGRWSEAHALAIQPDGKIVVAGTTATSPRSRSCSFVLVRYDPDGTLDPTFGTGGKATTPASTDGCPSAQAVGVRPDGTLVAAGANGRFVMRYGPDGSVDPSFGKRGRAAAMVKDFSGLGLVLQPDGKLVVAGASGTSDTPVCALVRYTRSGAADPAFGRAGKVTAVRGGCSVDAVASQRDGKLIAASYVASLLLRFNANGSLDRSFGRSGVAAIDLLPEVLAVQSDGKIVVAGAGAPPHSSATSMFTLQRFNRTGTVDHGFGRGGEVHTQLGSPYGAVGSEIDALAIQADGKLVAGGYYEKGSVLVRYEPNGSLDRSFGTNGIVTTAARACCSIAVLAVQPDGRIVAAGTNQVTKKRAEIALARYLP